jgi:hypothetical protein
MLGANRLYRNLLILLRYLAIFHVILSPDLAVGDGIMTRRKSADVTPRQFFVCRRPAGGGCGDDALAKAPRRGIDEQFRFGATACVSMRGEAGQMSLHRKRHAALVAAAFVASAPAGAPEVFAAGPSWKQPDTSAALGFLALQCDRSDFCFAVACPGGRLQLVNMSGGAGPYGGAKGEPATLIVAGKSYTLSFVWDDSILEIAGNAGSRASVPVEVLTALASGDGRITGNRGVVWTVTIHSQGLRQLWPTISNACKVPALPKR